MVKSVLIADDQKMIRQALCFLFSSEEDFDVCGDAEKEKLVDAILPSGSLSQSKSTLIQ